MNFHVFTKISSRHLEDLSDSDILFKFLLYTVGAFLGFGKMGKNGYLCGNFLNSATIESFKDEYT